MKRFLLICVMSIIVMCSFSVISNATGVVTQAKEMEEGSSIFSDSSTVLQDDFVIPNSTTYTVSRSRSVGEAVPTEAELLNIRQTIPLSERQSMCATALVQAMRDYQNTVGVNVLQYALTNSEEYV